MKKILLILLISMLSVTSITNASDYLVPLVPERANFELSLPEWYDTSTRLLKAQIWVESRGNSEAYNLKEDAVGILQIRPVMLSEVNRILKHSKSQTRYTLKDRKDSVKSVEMWRIVMNKHNPTYDVRKAVLIWNGKGKSGKGNQKYYEQVKNRLLTLIK